MGAYSCVDSLWVGVNLKGFSADGKPSETDFCWKEGSCTCS